MTSRTLQFKRYPNIYEIDEQIDTLNDNIININPIVSQTWSTNSPRADDVFVLRAWIPSIASKWQYIWVEIATYKLINTGKSV